MSEYRSASQSYAPSRSAPGWQTTQLTIERLGTNGVIKAPIPSCSSQRARPRPIAPNVSCIVASIRASVSMRPSLFRGDAPQGVVGALALAALDRLADEPPGERHGAAVTANVDSDAQSLRPPQLKASGHLVLRLVAPHQAAAHRLGVG